MKDQQVTIKQISTKEELLSRVVNGYLSLGSQATPRSLEEKGLIAKEPSDSFNTKIYVTFSTGYGCSMVTRYA